MIAHLRGHLVQKYPSSAVIEVNGIGYQVWISLLTFYQLPDPPSEIILYTYTYVREDLLQLFGFLTEKEKDIFQLLIGVSGIGPKLALNILSGISPEELLRCLASADLERLRAIPGVGRKTAERLLLDLREKAHRMVDRLEFPFGRSPTMSQVLDDVISALVNLGYKRTEAEKTAERLLQKNPGISLEQALRECLHQLSLR